MNTETDDQVDKLLSSAAASVDSPNHDGASAPVQTLQAACDVLVADDAGLSRELLITILRSFNRDLRIREARDGESAVKLYTTLRPHVTLLDIDMPGIDGIAAMHRIREMDAKAFVGIVSGSSSAANVKAALQGGANAFVVKPFMPQRIIDLLQRFEKATGRSLAG